MNTITYILIIAVLVVILCAVIRKALSLKSENEKLESLAENYKDELCKYMTELAVLRKDGDTVKKEIANAESEEEILDILGNIISRNNNRVQK